MKPCFKEKKTTQAAALLLSLNRGKMNYLKLLKLLYIADREALLRYGRPITYDNYVSMDYGPVLSQTLNIINGCAMPERSIYWSEFISKPENYEIKLLKESPTDELSPREKKLIEEVFREDGAKDQWELVKITHDLPEWQDPLGSAIPIDYRDILRAGNKTEGEIADILQSIESLAVTEEILSE